MRQDEITITCEGLEEELRCTLCRNPMHTDKGCDGLCAVDKTLLNKILQVIKSRTVCTADAKTKAGILSELPTITAFAGEEKRKADPFPDVKSIHFESSEEMLSHIYEEGDLWNRTTEEYVFHYSESGSICVYRIGPEEAAELNRKSAANSGEYWSAFLGMGGNIFDPSDSEDYKKYDATPQEWCDTHFDLQGGWIPVPVLPAKKGEKE